MRRGSSFCATVNRISNREKSENGDLRFGTAPGPPLRAPRPRDRGIKSYARRRCCLLDLELHGRSGGRAGGGRTGGAGPRVPCPAVRRDSDYRFLFMLMRYVLG